MDLVSECDFVPSGGLPLPWGIHAERALGLGSSLHLQFGSLFHQDLRDFILAVALGELEGSETAVVGHVNIGASEIKSGKTRYSGIHAIELDIYLCYRSQCLLSLI